MKPLGDRIIVRPAPRERTTDFGLTLPDSKDAPTEGTVTAAGPGRWLGDGTREPVDVREGDRILFREHAGFEQGDDLVLTQRDVLAVIE